MIQIYQTNFSNIVVDGKIGPITLSTLQKIKSDTDKKAFVKILNIMQGSRYIEIMERNETQEVFARGWFSRVSI